MVQYEVIACSASVKGQLNKPRALFYYKDPTTTSTTKVASLYVYCHSV